MHAFDGPYIVLDPVIQRLRPLLSFKDTSKPRRSDVQIRQDPRKPPGPPPPRVLSNHALLFCLAGCLSGSYVTK